MKLKEWRRAACLTLEQAGFRLGLEGRNVARAFQRFETGEVRLDVDMIDRIVAMTGGAVQESELLAARRDWLGSRLDAVTTSASADNGGASRSAVIALSSSAHPSTDTDCEAAE